jgi:hypothetical protein
MALAALYTDIGNGDFLQASDLVMHEGEQWIDQDRDPFHQEGGKHEAEALASTGGKHYYGSCMSIFFVVLFYDPLDDQLLEWVEGRDVETFPEEPLDLVLQEMCIYFVFHTQGRGICATLLQKAPIAPRFCLLLEEGVG